MTLKKATAPTTVPMSTIREKQLFIVPGIGVLRRTEHPCMGHDRNTDKIHVIYPDEHVRLLSNKKRG